MIDLQHVILHLHFQNTDICNFELNVDQKLYKSIVCFLSYQYFQCGSVCKVVNEQDIAYWKMELSRTVSGRIHCNVWCYV